MFRKIRNIKRKLSVEDAERILEIGEYGVLATVGENDYPYTTPVNYLYLNNSIYFHSALEGHKLDNINFNQKVSFCVVDNTHILKSKFSTAYESAIAFGQASIVENEAEKRKALEGLIDKYTPEYKEAGINYINSDLHKTAVVKIDVEHISSKGRVK